MAEVLLFVTGSLADFIAGYFISGRSRASSGPKDSTESLSKEDAGLEQFSKQLEVQKEELRTQQKQLQEARETAAVSRTQLEQSPRSAMNSSHQKPQPRQISKRAGLKKRSSAPKPQRQPRS